MMFVLKADPAGCEEGFKELLQGREHTLTAETEGAIALFLEENEGEKITVCYTAEDGAKTARLCAGNKTFFFRAFMTLLRELEKRGEGESFTLEEKVWLDRNGTMLDCSRNSVLTVKSIKEYIRLQAGLGMNTMMLYTEDTYDVPEYPYFGAYRGKYTKEELKEADAYAELFGIEMIPCIQTLAHLKNALRWGCMRDLCDTDDIMMVGEEKVYDFIEACIRNASECFRTKRIHLGMDEAWSLGLGRYLGENGYHTKAEIMSAHLERVTAICKKMDLEPMIWSDMYFCLNAKDGSYYGVDLDSDLSGAVKPPKEVTLVYWDYYHNEPKFYEEYLRMHGQLSDKVIFAGGGWVWNGIAPNLTIADRTTEAALAACKKMGVKEAVCTMWQDDGAETPMAAGILPIVRFAEHGFAEKVSEEQIKEQFEFLTGASYEAFRLLDAFDTVPEGGDTTNTSKYLLYQDVLLGLFDAQIEGWEFGDYYAGLRNRLEELAEKKAGNVMDDVLAMYAGLADAISIKADLGNRLIDAYQKQDRGELAGIAEEELTICIDAVECYRDLREKVWNLESKIFGFEVIDLRLGGLIGRLKTAQKRIEAYLDGEIAELPELEEKRLMFAEPEGNKRAQVHYNLWKNIVSASPI